MKSRMKPLFLSALLGVVTVSATITQVSAEDKLNNLSAEFSMANQMLVFPELASEGKNTDEIKPKLVLTPHDHKVEYKSCKSHTKKNQFFELAAIFNDKLQLVLASLHKPVKFSAAFSTSPLIAESAKMKASNKI